MHIIRYRTAQGDAAIGIAQGQQLVARFATPALRLADLLRLHLSELRMQVEQSIAQASEAVSLLAPIDGETEVWAAGVTYQQSEIARKEESATPDIYARVYTAQRPELFFKATPRRVAGPEEAIAIRSDSNWDVPEPELALVINAHAEIIGYTIANDVSSRSIEGENPLYLPQAKVYARSCALGPAITPVWELHNPYTLTIQMQIERAGQIYWQGQTSTGGLKRRLDELVAYLFREDDFPDGVILCTGTALVPEQPFTLEAGDSVQITIDGPGTLRNHVVRGKASIS